MNYASMGVDGDDSDVDIFVCAASAAEGCRIAKRIFEAMVVDNEHWFVNRGRGVLNLYRFARADFPAVRHLS